MSTIAAPSATSVAINNIETLAKNYSIARGILAGRIDALNAEIDAVRRRKIGGIKQALAEAKAAQEKLAASVQAAPELFQKPRTMTLHGIKCGFQKGSGKLDWDCDDEQLVTRIEKRYADDEAMLGILIIETKKPSRDGLKTLDVKELAKLGVQVEATGDFVVVKAADGEVDKLVKKVLAEGAIEETEAASS